MSTNDQDTGPAGEWVGAIELKFCSGAGGWLVTQGWNGWYLTPYDMIAIEEIFYERKES